MYLQIAVQTEGMVFMPQKDITAYEASVVMSFFMAQAVSPITDRKQIEETLENAGITRHFISMDDLISQREQEVEDAGSSD